MKHMLFQTLIDCINQKELKEKMIKCAINLMEKPGKDKKIPDNLRPITL